MWIYAGVEGIKAVSVLLVGLLAAGINKPPERSQILLVSSPQNAASLVYNWSVAPGGGSC